MQSDVASYACRCSPKPTFGGSAAQYGHVVKTIELGALRGLEVDAGFLAKRRGHNEPVKVVVGLIADVHRLAICSPSALQASKSLRLPLAYRRYEAMHFPFPLADVGVDLSLAPQLERDCSVDLFQGEGRETLLDRLRALAASEGVDDRIQRHPRARHVIAAISLFDVVSGHPSSDYTAKRAFNTPTGKSPTPPRHQTGGD